MYVSSFIAHYELLTIIKLARGWQLSRKRCETNAWKNFRDRVRIAFVSPSFKLLITVSVLGYRCCLWNARRRPQEEVSAKAESTPNLRWKVAFMLKSKRASRFACRTSHRNGAIHFRLAWIAPVFDSDEERKRGRVRASIRFATTVSLSSEMSCHRRKVHTPRVDRNCIVDFTVLTVTRGYNPIYTLPYLSDAF